MKPQEAPVADAENEKAPAVEPSREAGLEVARKKAPAPAAAPVPPPVVLPAGTSLKIRTTTALSTRNQQEGAAFAATLEEALAVGGRVIALKGAAVEGKVVESDDGGRVKGLARIAVALTRLSAAGGQSVEIATGSVAREARTTRKKDAVKIGIGSGIGAAVGAIAGGGKGAAIGAAAGAGAGTGAVLATRGDPAEIPGETVLEFELSAPVTIPARN